jgi:membrane protein
VGPLAIGAIVWSTNWLIESSVAAVPATAGAARLVATPVSIGLTALTFAVIYAVLPPRSVPLAAAAVGGLVAALVFEGAKRGFVLYVTEMPTYQHVYGAVAIVPLFLLWVFVSWLVVLFGAAVTATLAEGVPAPRNGGRRR